ncbi:MAG: DUF4363 family protein [Clostridia bacterium]|nr:DUF4363 family protein [Clostridia bacterium]
MKKVWVSVIFLGLIFGGGIMYNVFLGAKADNMLNLAEEAKSEFISSGGGVENIVKIEKELEGISAFLCAFLDRDIINEAEEAIVSARELCISGSEESVCAIELMKEKIRHIKNSATIKLKYILFRGEVKEYVAYFI